MRGPAGPTGNIGKLPQGPMKEQMKEAATQLHFEQAAKYRDQLKNLKEIDLQMGFSARSVKKKQDY